MREQFVSDIASTSNNYRFSAAVAGFGQLLRGGEYVGSLDFQAVEQLAVNARGNDSSGYRGEFLNMLRTASVLQESESRPGARVARCGSGSCKYRKSRWGEPIWQPAR